MTSALLEPSTLAALGISTQPFVAPAEDALYVDEALDLQVRLLRHNLQYSTMLQVLCGLRGAGKTTLIIRLVDVVNQELELFVARGDADLGAERVITDMLRALEAAHDDSGDVAQAFADALSVNSEVDAPAALVVDDAHLLAVRELSQLLAVCARIDEASASGLRLLLVGEPPLKHMLEGIESPWLKPGRVFIADVEPLSEQQTQSYLAHRFASVGATWPFDDAELAAIHERAGGLPGRIDEVAAAILNHRHSRARLTEPPPPAAPAPPPAQRRSQARPRASGESAARRPLRLRNIAAALAVVLVVWWLWPGAERDPEPLEQPLPIPEPAPPTVVFKDELPEPSTPGGEAVDTRTAPPGGEPLAGAGASESAPPGREAAPGSTAAADADAPGEAQPLERAADVTATQNAGAQSLAAKGAGSTPAATRPAAVSARAPAAASAPAAPAPARTTTPTPTQTPKTSATPTRRAEAWLLARPANRYVVQLVAMRDLGALRQFVQHHDLTAQGAVFTTRRNGAAWHVLVYGDYANAESARAAIAQLPAELRRNSPWIRSFASVHRAIRNQTP